MVKKINDIPDGTLMSEFWLDREQLSTKSTDELKQILATIKEGYSQKLIEILELSVKSMDELSVQERKEAGLEWSGKDIFVVVDENDKPTAFEMRALCHNWLNTHNKIHRASDWIIVNENGDVLLSQRSMGKDSYPGYWEIGWGHMDELDDYETTLKRELSEELWLWESDIVETIPLMKFLHKEKLQQQFIKVFVVWVRNNVIFRAEDAETTGQEFVSEQKMIENMWKIFRWWDAKYQMIPHQIFCILWYYQKKWCDVSELMQEFQVWKKTIFQLELDKIEIY